MDFWGRKPENDFIRAFEEVTEGHENNHEAQLSTERMEELEIQIQQDEKPIKLEPDESGLPETERKKKKLKEGMNRNGSCCFFRSGGDLLPSCLRRGYRVPNPMPRCYG